MDTFSDEDITVIDAPISVRLIGAIEQMLNTALNSVKGGGAADAKELLYELQNRLSGGSTCANEPWVCGHYLTIIVMMVETNMLAQRLAHKDIRGVKSRMKLAYEAEVAPLVRELALLYPRDSYIQRLRTIKI